MKNNPLETLVNNKSIILVGNSNTLNIEKRGKEIDSFECIIRFNKAIQYLNDIETTGIRTSIWVFAMLKESIVKSVYNLAKYKPEYCVRYSRNPLSICGNNDIFFDCMGPKQECRKKLGISNNKHPSTGVVILMYLLNHCNAKSITLTGFDAFQTPNFYTNVNANNINKWHEPNKESMYIQGQLLNKKTIQVL